MTTKAIGLQAAVEDYQPGPGGEMVRRWKRESHLLHNPVAADPKKQIAKLIAAAQQLATTPDPDSMGPGKLSDADLKTDIATCQAAAASVLKKDIKDALSRIQRQRQINTREHRHNTPQTEFTYPYRTSP